MDKKFFNRLRRLEGQLAKLHSSIEAEADCSDVIPQFLAVKGAVAGAFEEYIKQSMSQCATKDKQKLERLIMLLAKS